MAPSRSRRRVTTALGVVLAACTAAPALAAPPQVTELTRPRQLGYAQLGIALAEAPSGAAVAAWRGIGSSSGGDPAVQVATRAPSAGWTPPQEISAAFPGTDFVDVAINRNGDMVAVWTHNRRPSGRPPLLEVHAALRPVATGEWTVPSVISDTTLFSVQPAVVIDDAGAVVAAWQVSPGPGGGGFRVQSAARPAGSGTWSAPVDIAPPGQGGMVRLAVNAHGTVLAQWGFSGGVKHTAMRPPGGPFGPVEDIAGRAEGGEQAAIALAPSGEALYAEDVDVDGSNGEVRVATRPPVGPWGSLATVAAA